MSHTTSIPRPLPLFRRRLAHLLTPLAPLVSITTGVPHPAFPPTLLHYHLLTSPQLDALATHYHQSSPKPESWRYPVCIAARWRMVVNPQQANASPFFPNSSGDGGDGGDGGGGEEDYGGSGSRDDGDTENRRSSYSYSNNDNNATTGTFTRGLDEKDEFGENHHRGAGAEAEAGGGGGDPAAPPHPLCAAIMGLEPRTPRSRSRKPTKASVSDRRRRFGRFVGLRGCESPGMSGEEAREGDRRAIEAWVEGEVWRRGREGERGRRRGGVGKGGW